MMRPNALKGNDRIGNYKSITYGPTDWRTEGNLSTATATFGGRCARELFWCYPWLFCFLDRLRTWNSQFRAIFTKAIQKSYIATNRRADGGRDEQGNYIINNACRQQHILPGGPGGGGFRLGPCTRSVTDTSVLRAIQHFSIFKI